MAFTLFYLMRDIMRIVKPMKLLDAIQLFAFPSFVSTGDCPEGGCSFVEYRHLKASDTIINTHLAQVMKHATTKVPSLNMKSLFSFNVKMCLKKVVPSDIFRIRCQEELESHFDSVFGADNRRCEKTIYIDYQEAEEIKGRCVYEASETVNEDLEKLKLAKKVVYMVYVREMGKSIDFEVQFYRQSGGYQYFDNKHHSTYKENKIKQLCEELPVDNTSPPLLYWLLQSIFYELFFNTCSCGTIMDDCRLYIMTRKHLNSHINSEALEMKSRNRDSSVYPL